MTEKDIQRALWIKYRHHKYRFLNTYFFSSEQDYLTFLQNGYCWEFEIKVSKSDFWADFRKKKHLQYTNTAANVSLKPVKLREIWTKTEEPYDPESKLNRRYRIRTNWDTGETTYGVERHDRTTFNYKEIAPKNIPNRFYFATPAGLVKLDDIPSYAGLIEVGPGGVSTVLKKAPLIHKGKSDPKRNFNTIYYKYENVQRQNLFDE